MYQLDDVVRGAPNGAWHGSHQFSKTQGGVHCRSRPKAQFKLTQRRPAALGWFSVLVTSQTVSPIVHLMQFKGLGPIKTYNLTWAPFFSADTARLERLLDPMSLSALLTSVVTVTSRPF